MTRLLSAYLPSALSSSSTKKDRRRLHVLMVVERITYKKGWRIGVHEKDGRPYIQLHVNGTCSLTGKRAQWSGAKAWVSDFACDQEIVGIVYKLIKDAELHELHEWFRYRKAAIYNPHLNPDALVKVAQDKSNFMVRADSMTNV